MHCGSPSYAAPEIVARREYDGPPVDVWSAGVVLFAMVTGYLPFHAPKGEKHELCRKIMKGAFTTPESCARDFRDLVANILRVDPAKRATFAQVLESKWMRAHASASPGAGGAPGADRVPHGGADDPAAPRRYPARVGGGTAGAAALDESRVASLAAAGLDRDALVTHLADADHNYYTAAYHLLAYREHAAGVCGGGEREAASARAAAAGLGARGRGSGSAAASASRARGGGGGPSVAAARAAGAGGGGATRPSSVPLGMARPRPVSTARPGTGRFRT